MQRSVVTALSRIVKGTAQVGPQQTPSSLILLAQGLEVRRLLLGFGHKPAALVRQQSQGFLETKQLPGPQVRITMHPRCGGKETSLGWLAAAELLDLGFSGLVGEPKKSLSS